MIKVATLVVASIALLAAAPAAQAAERCAASKRKGSTVVERTRESVAFTRGANVYGCVYSRDVSRRLPLGDLTEADLVETRLLTLAGRFVAYTVEREARDAYEDPTGHLLVFDLVRGAVELDEPAATRGDSTHAHDVALKRNGSVAWTGTWCGPCRQQIGGVEVLRWEGGEVERLDSWDSSGSGASSAYVEPSSLRLSTDRRTVTWQTSAGPRSARLR